MRNKRDIKEGSQSIRFSIRIAGNVTSLSLRKNIVSLWLTLNTVDVDSKRSSTGIKTTLNGTVLNFIYGCLGKWEKDTAKGFSDFVSEGMITDILEEEDFDKYKEVYSLI